MMEERSKPAPSPTLKGTATEGNEGFDPSALEKFRRRRRPGRPNLLAKVLQTYLDETPRLLATIRCGAKTGAADEVVRAAHTLKSGSADFGALALSALGAELESLAEERGADCASEFVDRLEAEFERVRVPLEAELQKELREVP